MVTEFTSSSTSSHFQVLDTIRSNAKPLDAENTLLAIQEFTRYLHDMEEGLSRETKKLRNKETAQSAGLAANGIHEALNYLSIARKAIEKAQRTIQEKDPEHSVPARDLGRVLTNITDLDK